jgi:type I restriction enzyme M protein
LSRDKKNNKFRNREKQILFIDARNMGEMVNRRHRVLSPEDISRIANTYLVWKSKEHYSDYQNILGFCYSANLDDINQHRYALVPGRYTGAEAIVESDEPFKEKIQALFDELEALSKNSKNLDSKMFVELKKLI